jgi:hypothetical protein
MYDVIHLLGIILFIAHWSSCAFYFLALEESKMGRDDTWVHSKDLFYSTKLDKYVNSFYYSFITMLTIGYGDITPTTMNEKIFAIFIALIACAIFGYVINIKHIISKLFRRKKN